MKVIDKEITKNILEILRFIFMDCYAHQDDPCAPWPIMMPYLFTSKGKQNKIDVCWNGSTNLLTTLSKQIDIILRNIKGS